MKTTRRSIVVAACALAVVLAIVAWWVSSAESRAVSLASASEALQAAARPRESAEGSSSSSHSPSEREATPVQPEFAAPQHHGTPTAAPGHTLTGTVYCDDVADFEIRVAVFAFVGSKLALTPSDETFTDGNGPFVLTVKESGDFALLAFAHGHQPATLRFSIGAQPQMTLPAVRIEPGASISGVVRNAWTDAVRERIVHVRAREVDSVPGADVYQALGGRFVWREHAFDWAEIETAVDLDANFWLFGLRSETYSLSVCDVGALDVDFLDLERVLAPETGVMLTVGACTLNLHLYSRGAPAAGMGFVIRSVNELGGTSLRSLDTNADGNAWIMLVPYSRVEFQCGDTLRTITACSAGGELDLRIDL